MRKAPSALLLSVLVPLASVVPVLSAPAPTPRPVAPQVRSVPLTAAASSGGDSTGARRAGAAATLGEPGTSRRVTRTDLLPYDLLGVTWRAHSATTTPAVRVRTHSSETGWTGWTSLDVTPTPGRREARTARPGTEPLWVGESDGFSIRVDVPRGRLPSGLRVDLIDPGSSPADDAVGARRPVATASAVTAQPLIYSRADWGADESLRRYEPRYSTTVKTGFVHHTAGANGYSEAAVPKILRAIYAYHVKGNGWSDIGYNVLVDRFGRLWEGRAGGIDAPVMGAHTGGFNTDSFAVSAIGDYTKAAAPPLMVDAIARVLAWKLSLHFRDPYSTTTLTSEGGGTSRYGPGVKVAFDVISGHRDAGTTSCPGNNLHAQLGTIRALAASYLGTALMHPHPVPAAAAYGSGGSITASARVTTEQQWRLEVRDACRGTLVRTLTGSAAPGRPVAAPWDLRDEGGTAARPGPYSLTLASADALDSARTWTGSATVQASGPPPPPVLPVALPGQAGFVPLDPVPLYDSRSGDNLPLGPGGQLDLRVPGTGPVPETGVAAVALSIATSCASALSTITAWPAGSARPSSPALRVPALGNAAALAVTALGGDGMVSLVNRSGTTEVAVHVVGYYPVLGGSGYRPVRALRLYDSRRDPAGPLTPGATRSLTVPTLSGVPAAAMTGAMLNVTARGATGIGSLSVASTGRGEVGNAVAYAPGWQTKSRAVTRLDNGAFAVTARDATTHVVVDLVGWWAPPEVVSGHLFQAVPTRRVLDTRTGIGAPADRVDEKGVVSVRVAGIGRPVPANTKAVVLQLTGVEATDPTFVTAWPRGSSRPAIPDLRVPEWQASSNLVVVKVGTRGRVQVTNGTGSTHLVADVVGFYP